MTLLQYLAAVVAALLVLYIAVRLATAAYFRSKADHERRKTHGTR